MPGVLVIADVADGAVSPITAEMLGAASRVAGSLGGGVSAALIGSNVSGLAGELFAAGAEKVYVAEGAGDYLNGAHVKAAQAVVGAANPAAVFIGHTPNGRDLGARLAFRLGTGAAMDVMAVEADGGKLLATRSAYGGNARAQVSFVNQPAVLTVRAKSQEPLAAEAGKSGEVVNVAVDVSDAKGKVTGHEKIQSEGVRLEDAEVVVSGGRGLGGPEAFDQIESLANTLKGAVGASRAVCDLGWYPVANQVGLTGKVVSPNLYVAVAISGASQHMAGCGGSRNIVAINKDPDAPIFKAARFGIVGDWKQILPPLEAELKALLS